MFYVKKYVLDRLVVFLYCRITNVGGAAQGECEAAAAG